MKTLFALGVWCLLFVLCWPLAILALIAWPFVWLLSLPFRLVGITFSALLRSCARCSCCPRACSAAARWRHEGCVAGRTGPVGGPGTGCTSSTAFGVAGTPADRCG